MKRGWFGPRIVGWGASPASWEGWLITGVMVLALAGAGIAFNDRPHGWITHVLVLAVYGVIVLLTYRHDARTSI